MQPASLDSAQASAQADGTPPHGGGELVCRAAHAALVRRVDLLFTSEAMNLANLYRMMPALASLPSVVYFHENQLPPPDTLGGALELVNLNTATAATEIWFNSLYHLRTFLERASALVEKHPELSSRNPMPQLTAKAHLMRPPLDWSAGAGVSQRKRRSPQPADDIRGNPGRRHAIA